MPNELAVLIPQEEMTREKVELIKRTVAVGTSDDELALFLYTAQRCGLDPLSKQIYAIKRGGKMTIQTAIDGYRLIADRTRKLAGISDPIYDDESQVHPGKATVTVRKIVDGQMCEFAASVRWSEYCAGGPMWSKMPYLMLGKCAESLALRKAFPADLSGIYTNEEMSQADSPVEPAQHHADIVAESCAIIEASETIADTQANFAQYFGIAEKMNDRAAMTQYTAARDRRKIELETKENEPIRELFEQCATVDLFNTTVVPLMKQQPRLKIAAVIEAKRRGYKANKDSGTFMEVAK